MAHEKEVAEILLKLNAVTLSPKKPYKYAPGILSPIYCDNRIILSYPKERGAIVDFYIESIKKNELDADVIAGTATAGIAWAAWIAEKLGKPMIYIRSSSKDHGKENLIEGKLEKGQKVLVVEDLVSTGGSSLNAVRAAREAGGVVSDCIAIFTYGMEKARCSFEKEKCRLIALSDFSELVEVASGKGYIKKEDKGIVLKWNKNPEGWRG